MDHLDAVVVAQGPARKIVPADDAAVHFDRHAAGRHPDRLEKAKHGRPLRDPPGLAVEDDGHDRGPSQPAAFRAGFLINCLISPLSFPMEAWMISAAVPSSRSGSAQLRDTSPEESVLPSTSVLGLSTVLMSFTFTFAPAIPSPVELRLTRRSRRAVPPSTNPSEPTI